MVSNHARIEEFGIPTVAIVQKQFVIDAKSSGEAHRLENPTIVVTPNVFGKLSNEETRNAVDSLIDDIIEELTRDLPVSKIKSLDKKQRITTLGPKDDNIEFRGRDYHVCYSKMYDCFLEWGWCDGFPIIPPTQEAVNIMLQGTNRSPDENVIEHFVPGMAHASVKGIAINAVMAGCKPEFLPVVITAVQSIHDPDIPTLMCTTSTGAHAPLFIINGPVAKELNINSGACSLGPAGPKKLSYPNAVIGRAVRFCLMNLGNCYPGVMDQDTIGSPTKFSMVLAENENLNPWAPYHVEKGFNPEDSTVTCCYGHSLAEVCDMESNNAASLMNTFAIILRGVGERAIVRSYVAFLLIAPDHAKVLAADGWTKNDIQQYLHLHCRISAEEYRRSCCISYSPTGPRKWIDAAVSNAMVPLYDSPEHFEIVVVGGVAGKSAVYICHAPANPHLLENHRE